MKTNTPRPTKATEAATDVCPAPFTFWLAAAAACAACAACFVIWAAGGRAHRRAAVAELRLRRTRVRLRTAEAELREADEYLAATGELLEFYEETFGPLPFNPFAQGAGVEAAGAPDEWPERLGEAGAGEG